MEVNKNLYNNKKQILEYLRSKADTPLVEIEKIKERETRSKQINDEIKNITTDLINEITLLAQKESWDNTTLLNNVLMITYCSYIVMIEYRNKVWHYEYMTFSRRIGELWDPFCHLCWTYNINPDISIITPPTFKDVREKLEFDLNQFIDNLKLEESEKKELRNYYDLMWNLVTSGEVNMKLDLHFEHNGTKYMVDFKSGFSSNEKGNTNRLLLVASIYKSLNDNYECYIFVRSSEDESNHYLQTLKRSGIWHVFCADKAYEKMKEFTGFDIKKWIVNNVNWKEDFDDETMDYFEKNNLDIYLKW